MIVRTACLGAGLLITALLPPARAEQPACSIPQSPRNIDRNATPPPYNGTSTTSIVEKIDADSIVYKPRAGGDSQTLYRCGQHYHFPIETPQGCKGEIPPAGQPEAPGQYVEIHTAYAANKEHPSGCNPVTLDCCTKEPFLVRAFAAKVTAGGQDEPIPIPPGRPLAEWSGSTTGKEATPDECKPAAQWSFRLTCAETVSQTQLRRLQHADPARPVQPGDRLSKDLTLVKEK
jgi:hypothetical protein